jgi:hypothetical protein
MIRCRDTYSETGSHNTEQARPDAKSLVLYQYNVRVMGIYQMSDTSLCKWL